MAVIERIIETLRGLTTGERNLVVSALADEADESSGPTITSDERRQFCAELAAETQGYERAHAEVTRKHEAGLADIERTKRDAAASREALSELDANHRARRDALWTRLRETRGPAIGAFVEEMRELEADVPHLRAALRAADPRDPYHYVVGDNADSVERRRRAIEHAIHQADALSFEPLDEREIAVVLDRLRASVPAAETAQAVLNRKLREIRDGGHAPDAA